MAEPVVLELKREGWADRLRPDQTVSSAEIKKDQ